MTLYLDQQGEVWDIYHIPNLQQARCLTTPSLPGYSLADRSRMPLRELAPVEQATKLADAGREDLRS